MRFISFNTLKAKNFLSFGDKLITVDLKPGVNAITGLNLDKEDSKNGAGKSSILEILYYGLYGVTLREINKDHIQNSVTKKTPEVHVEFDILTNNEKESYRIVRKLNPTKCQLFKGSEEITRSTLAKTNKLVQDLIHTPPGVFQNSVIMTVNNALPFMALSKVDKRKFIESVLGLEVFTQMLLKVRDDYSIVKKDYEIAYNKLEQNESELSFNKEQFDNYETQKQDRLNKLLEREKKTESDIKVLEEKLKTILTFELNDYADTTKTLTSKIKEFDSLILELKQQESKNQTLIGSEKKEIAKYRQNELSCPTCERKYSENHLELIQNLIASHTQNVETYEKSLISIRDKTNKLISGKEQISEQLSNLQKQFTLNQNNKNEQQTTNNSILHLKDNLSHIREEIITVGKDHNNSLKGKISQLSETNETIKAQVSKLNEELNILETVKFILSEEGIKSFIVKKILQVLNSRLAYYLNKLEANCLCKFNEFFEEEIIDEKGESKSYFNFSGGERKRIDLATLFAFADVRRLQGDVYFSTVFYDELLDSSLDDRGVLLTLKVLRERYNENNESCYIITHRGPEVLSKAEHTIQVTKQNGITTVLS